MLDELLDRFRHGDRRALSRLLTLAARGEAPDVARALADRPARARVVAVTGSGGVGKSTLVGRLIEVLRAEGTTVAVLACDPQSPLSGGALLGDRFRMPNRPDDDGVFIRSLAALSGRGAVAEHLPLLVRLLDAFGFDLILVETVGAGQGDVAVRELADVVALLVQPETGDDLQWEKAGVLEVADVVVVHKADLPAAERLEAQLRALLHLPGCREVPIVRVSSQKNQGVPELVRLLRELPSRRGGQRRDGQALLWLAQQELAERFGRQGGAVAALVERWRRGEVEEGQAVREVLRALSPSEPEA
jgi:LAO/AO transport system ATPase